MNFSIGKLSNLANISTITRAQTFRGNSVSDTFSIQNSEDKKTALEKQLSAIAQDISDLKFSIKVASRNQEHDLVQTLQEELEKLHNKFQKAKDDLVNLSLGDEVYCAKTPQERSLALDKLIETQAEELKQLSKKINILSKKPNAAMPSQVKNLHELESEKKRQKAILRFYEIAKNNLQWRFMCRHLVIIV